MRIARYTTCAMGIAIALTLTASARAGAQVDTTRRAVSEKRIPVRKDQGAKMESKGEVVLPSDARINTLEATATALNQRIDALERANATLNTRSAETERLVGLLTDSLRMVRGELANLRGELANATARTRMLDDSVQGLSKRVYALGHHSYLFGNSGFYMGAGTGANFTAGTLNDIGYRTGLHVMVPIGFRKTGDLLGIRAELGVQSFQGRIVTQFANPDPMLYSGIAMLTLNLPLNEAKTNLVYLMGGGGVFRFRDIGTASGLNDRLGGTNTSATKFGVTGGAGLELHILGATSMFVEAPITNVFAEKSIVGGTGGRNLLWVPLVAGITLR
jgi:opacity protein-like surface antigen